MDINSAKKVILAATMADDTVIMEGQHGIGKSTIVKQFAKENGYHLEELFLSHQEVGDLIGIPHMIEKNGKSLTTWSTPVWLQRIYEKAEEGIPTILFLDELNRAPIDVRQSALQLVLEKQIHEHLLPEVNGKRTMIVAAINPADEYQVDELDPALLDRFLHINVEADVYAWLNWGKKEKLNPMVLDFIKEYPDRLFWQPKNGGTGGSPNNGATGGTPNNGATSGRGATPRSWAKLSNFINIIDDIPKEIHFDIFKGKIGSELAGQFLIFMKDYANVITIENIETFVEENKDKVQTIEELGDLINDYTSKMEAIQKKDMADNIVKKYIDEDPADSLAMVAFLYSLELEISAAFIKGFQETNAQGYSKLVKIDKELNNKNLFKRIIKQLQRL